MEVAHNASTVNSMFSGAMFAPLVCGLLFGPAFAQDVPQNALVVDRLKLNALETVQPPSVENLTTV